MDNPMSKSDYVQHADYHEEAQQAVVAQPTGTTAQDIIPGHAFMVGRRARPEAGKWVDGICCCWKQLYPSCCCAFGICHGCWLTAQIHEKTKVCTMNHVLCFKFFCVRVLLFFSPLSCRH